MTSLSNIDSVVVSFICFNLLKFVILPQNKFSIKNLLNSKLKDSIPPESKAGICQINCKDCEKIYIGKTKRNLETRVEEHFRNIKNGEMERSAIAAHVWKEQHAVDHKPVLLKQAANKQEQMARSNTLNE